jgi:hypothetical protein
MKLFVWADPYPVHYGTSMCIAVAETEEDARKQAEKSFRYSYVKHQDGIGGGAELGPPTRVLDIPCAEWHEWSE